MGRVNLINPNTGRVESFPDDEAALGAAMAKGYKAESTEAEIDRAAREGIREGQAGGRFGEVKAVAEGFKRGATAGLSDVAGAIGGNEGQREYQNALREEHSELSLAGEVGGGLALALATGGTSAGASGASTARAVGGAALRGSVEGAAQNAGMYFSDVALGNKELSAEGFFASAGTGAAFGGAIGGGVVAAERGMIAARKLLPKSQATSEAVLRSADDVDAELSKALNAGDDSIRSAKDQLELMRLQRAELDVAAQQRVLEKRAAEAAKAQASADLQAQKLATQKQLDDVRIAKAKEPKTSRPGRGGKTRSPVEQTPDVIPPAAVADDTVPSPVAAADDIVGAPIGNVRPSSDVPEGVFGSSRYGNAPAQVEDLEAQLARSVDQGKAGASAPVDDVLARAKAKSRKREPLTAQERIALFDEGKRVDNLTRYEVGDAVVGGPGGMGPQAGAAKLLDAPPPPKTALDEIHEAMAELDPDAAKLVDAVRAQEAAAANLQKRFRVRAPQEIGGSTTAVIPDAPNLTLGRVKQMYEVANDAEKAALLQQVGPEKAKALLEIVEGKAGFAKWYKNKNHWWDDPSYGPLPTKAGPSADDLGNLTPRVMPGAEGAIAGADDMARLADDELAALDDMHRAVAELSEYERSVTDLATVLGPTAPPSAMEMAAKYSAAVDDNARKMADRMAQVADEAPVPSAFPEGSGPVRAPEMPTVSPIASQAASPTPIADNLMASAAKQADTAEAADLVSLPGAGGFTAPAKKKGIGGLLADLGAANEALQFAGIALPFVPDVDKIPVIGPLVGGYLKMRAGMTVLGRAGFRVPLSGEARIAAGAARTRDRVAQSVDRLLGIGAKAARVARPVASSQAWRVPDALSTMLYDTGEKQPRAKSKDPTEMLAQRTKEVLAAQANPAGVKATVRAAMRDVRDPDVINAVYAVAQRKFDYLAKHAPVAPPPNPLSKSKWQASPAEIERFARRVRAANDPVSVLDDVATGRVTPEGAETLREVYPQLYSEARVRLIEQAPKLSRSLPHATIVRLSVLFDAPLVSSLEPDNLAAIQAAGKPQNDNGQGGAPMAAPQPAMTPPPAGAPDLSSMYMTPGQKRAGR